MGEARTESEKIVELINASPRAKKVISAENWEVVFQFNLKGEDEPFFVEISGGSANLKSGTHSNPSLIIEGDNKSVARASRGQGDFSHSICREEVDIKQGKVMELIRYSRAIAAALRDKKS